MPSNPNRRQTLAISGTGASAPEAFELVAPTLRELGEEVHFLSLTADNLGDPAALLEAANSMLQPDGTVTMLGISLGGLAAYTIASSPKWNQPTNLVLGNAPYGPDNLAPKEQRLLHLLRDKPAIGERAVRMYAHLKQESHQEFPTEAQTLAYKADMDARDRVPSEDIVAQLGYLAHYSFKGLTLPTETQTAHITSVEGRDRIVPRVNIDHWVAHHEAQGNIHHTLDVEAAHAELTAEPEQWQAALRYAYSLFERS